MLVQVKCRLAPMFSLGVHAIPERVVSLFLLCLLTVGAALSSAASREHYARGTALARSGKFEQALEELQKAAKLDAQNPRVHNMLGVVLTRLGRLQEANEAYSRALSLAPGFYAARKNRAVNSFAQGDFKFAAKEFEALAQLRPKDFVPRLFLGLLALEGSGFPAARRYLLEARRLSPDNGQVLLGLTRAHFALGERQLALETAREMEARSQSSDVERFQLGVLLAEFGANGEAAEVFRDLWLKKPGSYDLGFHLTFVQYRAGKTEAALRTVEELRSRASETAELLNLLGRIYYKLHRLEEAKESLRRAIEVESQNADHYLDLSTILLNGRDLEGAIRLISEGIQKNVEKDRLLVQLGLLHQKTRDPEQAEKCFREALEANSGNSAAYLALANLLAATDRYSGASDLLAKATKLLPEDPLLHYAYGGLLSESVQGAGERQLEEAARVLKKALELNPFYANTHYLLGKLSLTKGDYDSAQSYFEKACAYNPNHAKAYHQLSIIARRQGKKEKAAELSSIVKKLAAEEEKSFREDFVAVVEESLSGEPRAGSRTNQ